MKKMLFSFLLFASAAAMAQSDKFTQAMQKNIAKFDSVKTTADYQALAASFERIGDAEKTQWLPYYYAGLALTNAGWAGAALDKDENAEKVKALCDKADALATDNADKAEILSIRNMAATQQMIVDPQSRWMSYGQEASGDLQKAMTLNPDNPRLYYLQGMSVFGTPEQFGGGKEKAKPIFEKAVALYKTEQPKPLYPHWGQKQAEDKLAECQ
jgi:tetratricopeptide (TPR) repeat protein